MKSFSLIPIVSSFGFALFASSARADVLTVGSGGTFTNIQAAVDAASDGDTILVHAGTYAGFRVGHKSVAIAVDPSTAAVTAGQVTVSNLAAGQRCMLSGLHVSSASGPALSAFDNVGSLRLESLVCTVSSDLTSGDAAHISNCQDVALIRCTLTGGDGHSILPVTSPGLGVRAMLSNVAVYDCTVQGGGGLDGHVGDEGFPVSPGPGAVGCSIDGGQLFCSGSAITGGGGGHGYSAFCAFPHYGGGSGEIGGTGLQVISGSATALDTSIIGGAGGLGGLPSPSCSLPGGANGPAGLNFMGTLTVLAGAHKSFTASTLVREQTSLHLTVAGALGDSVWLSVARNPGWVFTGSRKGVTLVGEPTRSILLGTIGSNGLLQTSLPIDELGPGVQASTLFLQAVCIDPLGHPTLTGSDFVVLLDQAF